MNVNSVYEAPHIQQVIKFLKGLMSMRLSNQRKVKLFMHKRFHCYYLNTLAALKDETVSQ